MQHTDNKESEIKIKLDEAEAVYQKALAAGGEVLGEDHEHDTMYTNDSADFVSYEKHAPKKVLRLRRTNTEAQLTYKEKLEGVEHAHLLERKEVELTVSDYDKMHEVLLGMRFKPYRIKEKIRRRVKLHNLVLEFDKLPFTGDYLEIEGEIELLQQVLGILGLKIEQGLNRDYTQLFYDYCQAHGLDIETPQTFAEEKQHLQAAGQLVR